MIKKTKSNQGSTIPRPLNCFLIFRNEKQKEIIAKCPGANHCDISKIIAKWWRETTEEEKDVFRNQARIAKQEHSLLYPNYTFAPKRKEKPKRSYIRKGQNENFTSRSSEKNRYMEIIYGDVDTLNTKPIKTKKKKIKERKTRTKKEKIPRKTQLDIALTDICELIPQSTENSPMSIESYTSFDPLPLMVYDTASTNIEDSPVLSIHLNTPSSYTDIMNTNLHFPQDFEDCLSFPTLDTLFNETGPMMEDPFTPINYPDLNFINDQHFDEIISKSYSECNTDLPIDYAHHMFYFDQHNLF